MYFLLFCHIAKYMYMYYNVYRKQHKSNRNKEGKNMTTKKRLQIIAASVERNRRRDAAFAQKQKNPAKKKGEKKCRRKP